MELFVKVLYIILVIFRLYFDRKRRLCLSCGLVSLLSYELRIIMIRMPVGSLKLSILFPMIPWTIDADQYQTLSLRSPGYCTYSSHAYSCTTRFNEHSNYNEWFFEIETIFMCRPLGQVHTGYVDIQKCPCAQQTSNQSKQTNKWRTRHWQNLTLKTPKKTCESIS